MEHSLLTCIKDTKCFRGKNFLDSRPFLVMKIRLYTAWNKHVCHKAIPRWNKYPCLSPLGTQEIRRKSDSNTHLYHHIWKCQLTLTMEAPDFTICFSTIIVGLNQGPVSRRHANKQDGTCPELLSLQMLSLLSFININKDIFMHTTRRPESISCKYQNQ